MWPNIALAAGFGAAAAGATVLGGLLALRFQRALGGLLAFGAGVVLGVALLDLLPEALALGEGVISPVVTCAGVLAGFFLYLVVGRLTAAARGGALDWPSRLSVASLVLHSGLDGFGIGCAFQAGAPIGLMVASGVVAHDMVDGSNTVVFSLNGRANAALARRWLLFDGVAPIGGILVSMGVRAPRAVTASLLALMSGGFLYLAGHYLRSVTRSDAPLRAVGLAGLGLVFVALAVRLASL